MELAVTISQDFNGSISITDYSSETDTGYLTGSDVSLLNYRNKFFYDLTATIDVIKYLAVNEEKLIDVLYVSHLYTEADSNRVDLPYDGHFTIDHVVLPTKEWLTALKADQKTNGGSLKDFFEGYSTTGVYLVEETVVDDKVVAYKLYNYKPSTFNDDGSIDESGEVFTEIPLISGTNSLSGIETLLDNVDTPLSSFISTVSSSSYNVFSIARLKDCYVSAAKNILDQTPKCGNISDTDRFNRDFLWMTINVINIWLEKDEYDMAQTVLERLGCYNFCPDILSSSKTTSSCGCNKS